jgi:hypothetical protein
MSGEARPWYKRLWDGWMTVARVIGNFNARLIISLFYFIFMVPLGLVMGTARDFLGIREKPSSSWQHKPGQPRSVEEGRKQF